MSALFLELDASDHLMPAACSVQSVDMNAFGFLFCAFFLLFAFCFLLFGTKKGHVMLQPFCSRVFPTAN